MQHDLIVSFLSSVPSSILSQFKKRPLTIVSPVAQAATAQWPGGSAGYQAWLAQYTDRSGAVIPRLARAAGAKSGDTIGRVCVMGFSNGCTGVYHMLRKSDSAKIDTVLAIDGIHGAYVGGGLLPSRYKPYLNHAVNVIRQDSLLPHSPVMVVTHSSIVPPFPSTTETASLIWDHVIPKAPAGSYIGFCAGSWPCPPLLHESLIAADNRATAKVCAQGRCYEWHGITDGWYDRRYGNNFFVFGWGDEKNGKITTKDPRGYTDHIFQGRYVLPAMLKEFCVKRWQRQCGPVAVVGVGQDDHDATVCKLEEGLVYAVSTAKKVDYFPDLASAPVVKPKTCPAPPPGSVIVGTATDPCAVSPLPGEPALPGTPAEAPRSNLWGLAALGAGVAVGAWSVTQVVDK